MSETYNVQERSFIKKPEAKVCPTCGQPIAPDVKPMSNAMNHYLNPLSGRVVVINSNENIIKIDGTPIYKVDGKDLENKPTSSFIPKPDPQGEKLSEVPLVDKKILIPNTPVPKPSITKI